MKCAVLLLSVLGVVKAISDAMIYDLSSQPTCEMVTRSRRSDCRWVAGLDMADLVIEKGRIVAYQIQWFNGGWSTWYVPGLNDIDWKFNIYAKTCDLTSKANSMRRVWSYFYDHNHKYILCKPH
ncbi:hypothetical protein MAR_004698 [Mya arenaria]|uniref:Uncharacterized protein n=1 Tax=Mya arenaria TaxID=6604 RepID=A0ABY7EXC0_MYAAR|nr:uncharacterized protein LOC128245443 [Mya arenaria]WAR14593.1 hypothetical protein MAR_004698 [Mya arenaria]